MSSAKYYNLEPADVLITPKSNIGMVKHFVVFHGFDNNGVAYYLENKQGVGVRQIDETTFERENTILEIRKFKGSDYERELAINRGTSLLGQSYSLWNFNCEHFANHVQFNAPVSIQINNVKDGLGAGFAMAAVGLALVGIASMFED
jgi:hypothetical protein